MPLFLLDLNYSSLALFVVTIRTTGRTLHLFVTSYTPGVVCRIGRVAVKSILNIRFVAALGRRILVVAFSLVAFSAFFYSLCLCIFVRMVTLLTVSRMR